MHQISTRFLAALAASAACTAGAHAATAPAPGAPRLAHADGRTALFVDGAPFLVLGAQANNSSNYPAVLGKVWPALDDLHANTLEIPVAWEQIEPVEGRFDFSYVDTLLTQAREHGKRLVLLWFGTWKNTSPSYAPEWVKFDDRRFPRMVDRDGKASYCLSPFGEETLAADRKAFVALMTHLAQIDTRHTVILVQVENEVGTYGLVRDFGAKAQAAFERPVPAAVLARQPAPVKRAASGNWREVYGDYADEYFHAWAIASSIEQVAKAGRAVFDVPMYVNNALRDAVEPLAPWKSNFASGGPTYDVIGIYKAAAPHVDIAAPDLYNPASAQVDATLAKFQRADNPLWVPEMSHAPGYGRVVYDVLGRGALGIAPFGIDYTSFTNFPLGAKEAGGPAIVEPFAATYAVFGSMDRLWARWAFEGRTHGVAEGDDRKDQTIALGSWTATVSFQEWQFGEKSWPNHPSEVPPGTEKPSGGVAIAQVGPDEFVITGQHARVRIASTKPQGKGAMFARVEEGRFDAGGQWVMERNWNGDQTDWGLNFTASPVILRVRMGRY